MEELFENAGEKIKAYAVALFIVEIVISAIGGIVLWFSMADDHFLLGLIVGALVAGFGILAAYLTSLFLVAYGDLVEKTTENQQVNKEILEYLKGQKTASVEAPVAQPVQSVVHTRPVAAPTAQSWFCAHCGTENSKNYSMCKKCGKYRG